MNVEKMFESRFIKSADFNGKDWTFTISGTAIEKLDGKKGPQKKGIIAFEGTEKAWVINRTNALCCVAMWGTETDSWIGKRITLHPIVWQGEELAIRVKGSPDLERPMPVEIKLPKKSAFTITLQKTNPADRITPRGSAAKGKPAAKSAAKPVNGEGEREPTEDELAAGEGRAAEEPINF